MQSNTLAKNLVTVGMIFFLAIIIGAPQFAVAQSITVKGSCGLINTGIDAIITCASGIFKYAIYLMMAASVVMITWGAFQMISNEEKRPAGRQTIIYGVIGLFVMISIWGFVNILDETFGLSDITAASLQSKYTNLIPSRP